MWRATIEILDFVPLSSADYGGGIVITDWYADTGNEKESIKIMVQFLSNEVRADGIKVIVYNKFCSDGLPLFPLKPLHEIKSIFMSSLFSSFIL